MRFHILILLFLSLFVFSSCMTTGEVYDIAFPDDSTLDSTTFWVDSSEDPLGLASIISERLSYYGFSSYAVSDLSSLDDYASVSSSGTAFAVSSNLLITNSHVIGDADSVSVFIDGEDVMADVIRNEKDADLAILRIESRELPYAFDLSNEIEKGEHISVLGYPIPSLMGEECKYTEGIVNSLSGLDDTVLRMQISAEIQPGNSGGPVLDENYNVIGVATEKLSDFYTMANIATVPQTVNYAIKGDIVMYIAENLIQESKKAESVDSLQKAEKAVFLVKSDKTNSLQSDVIIDLEYTFDFHEGYYSFYSYTPANFSVDPITLTLYTVDGMKIGEIISEGWGTQETAYETAEYLADCIFTSWVDKLLPQNNRGEQV